MFLETGTFPGRHAWTRKHFLENVSGDRNIARQMFCGTMVALPAPHPTTGNVRIMFVRSGMFPGRHFLDQERFPGKCFWGKELFQQNIPGPRNIS
jgi:hypothetical protein